MPLRNLNIGFNIVAWLLAINGISGWLCQPEMPLLAICYCNAHISSASQATSPSTEATHLVLPKGPLIFVTST